MNNLPNIILTQNHTNLRLSKNKVIMNRMRNVKNIVLLTMAPALCPSLLAENYYGGTTDGSTQNTSISNTIDGATYDAYFGGNVNIVNPGSASGDVYGDITNELTNVTINGNFIGANWTNDSSGKPSGIGAVTGKVTNIFDNSKVLGRTYGGNLSSGPNSQWTIGEIGEIETIIKNGSYIKEIGISGGASISRIKGSVSLKVENSTVDEIYHNGGIYIGGDCNISINNSTVKNYFDAAPAPSGSSWIKNGIGGNLNITLEGNTVVDGSAYPQLTGDSAITCAGACEIGGSVNFTIKDKAQVLGWISAGSQNTGPNAKKANFNVESYTGESPLSIRGFDTVDISESTVVFGNSFDVEKLIIDTLSKITLAEGTFFDTLSLVFVDGEFTSGETYSFDLKDIFTDTTIVDSALENSTKFTVFDSNGNEWNAVYNQDGSILIGAMVPESSTYAAALGLAALAFVLYRKRR